MGNTKKYTFTDMIDGKYTFLEVLSQKGDGVVFPDSWRIKITNQGTTVYDHTFTGSVLTKDTNGDCRLDQIELTGLTGGGVMEMTIHNKTLTAPLEIIKRSDDDNVASISFTVEQDVPGIGYVRLGTYLTNANGYITIPNLTIGTKLRVTESVPDGYTSEQETQEIVIAAGTNTLTFVNHKNPVVSSLTIRKTSDDGNIAGISFTVEQDVTGIGYVRLGTYQTNANGYITIACCFYLIVVLDRKDKTVMQKLFSFPTLQIGMLIILLASTLIIYIFVHSTIQFLRNRVWKSGITALLALVISIPAIIVVCGMFLSALEIKTSIAAQNPLSVTGYVCNYHLSAEGGHDRESFQVSDVQFTYTSYELTWYYCETQSSGGVIKGDGQYVTIQYLPKEKSNRIIYIAEDPSRSHVFEDESAQKLIVRHKTFRWIAFSVIAILVIAYIICFCKQQKAHSQ